MEVNPIVREEFLFLRLFFDDSMLLVMKNFSFVSAFLNLIFAFLNYLPREFFIGFFFYISFTLKMHLFFLRKLYKLHHLLIHLVLIYVYLIIVIHYFGELNRF